MQDSPLQEAIRHAQGKEGGRKITQWCKFYSAKDLGGCQRGQYCTFAHHETDLGRTYCVRERWVSTHRMVLCKYFMSGKRCGPGCRFAHGRGELGLPLTAKNTPETSQERSEELGLDSGEAKTVVTEERTETKSDESEDEADDWIKIDDEQQPPLPLPGSDPRGCAHAPRGPCVCH